MEKSDQRILGSGDFVEKVMDQADAHMKYQLPPEDLQKKQND